MIHPTIIEFIDCIKATLFIISFPNMVLFYLSQKQSEFTECTKCFSKKVNIYHIESFHNYYLNQGVRKSCQCGGKMEYM